MSLIACGKIVLELCGIVGDGRSGGGLVLDFDFDAVHAGTCSRLTEVDLATFWIGTGWKMNKTVAETHRYISALRALLPPASEDFAFFVVPPFTALAAAREAIGDAPLLLGAQNMHWADAGAFTGEISAAMLSELSIDIVELGHSERRQLFGETDQALNLKVKTALRYRLRPLLCVGDTAEERDAGASAEAVVRQVKLAFAGLAPSDVGRCMIAYEPIWAIGEGGVAATPEHIREVHRAIDQAIAELAPGKAPVLYGGSVTADNAPELAAEATVNGLFIGRAAWDPTRFAAMIRSAMAARGVLRAEESVTVSRSGEEKIELHGSLVSSQRRGDVRNAG